MKNNNLSRFCRSGQIKVFGLLLATCCLFQGQVTGQIQPNKKILTPATKPISKQVIPIKTTPDGPVTIELSSPSMVQNDVPLNATFAWTASPATGLTFDVYLAKQRDDDAAGNHRFSLVSENQTASTYQANLAAGEIYYWKVAAKKNDGSRIESPVFFFFTLNQAPSAAMLTSPAEGATQVAPTPTLSWQASTDPEMKRITYSVSLATKPGQYGNYLATSLSGTSYTLTTPLRHGETYYWKVTSMDDAHKSTESEESWFTVNPVNWAEPITTGSFTDPRDNKTYKTVKIGQQEWMAENLALLPAVNNTPGDVPLFKVYGYTGTDVAEAGNTENYREYGVLYNWNAAQQVCPAGWHLPSDAEWNQLLVYLGMTEIEANNNGLSNIVADKMREQGSAHWTTPSPTVNNASGFNALPAGFAMNAAYNHLGNGTTFWTSTGDASQGIITRELYYPPNSTGRIVRQQATANPLILFSIRCVKDEQ